MTQQISKKSIRFRRSDDCLAEHDAFVNMLVEIILTFVARIVSQLNKLDNVQEMINSGGAVPVKDNVEYAISRVDDLVNWARKGSLWPSKSSCARGGSELFQRSDLIVFHFFVPFDSDVWVGLLRRGDDARRCQSIRHGALWHGLSCQSQTERCYDCGGNLDQQDGTSLAKGLRSNA